MRQWIYQTCNEYGWYQTSGSANQPFGTKFPVALYTTMCYDAYGDQFTNEFINQQIDQTNAVFGGLKPEVENVYITHGQLDPWRAMGIQSPEEATIIPCKLINIIMKFFIIFYFQCYFVFQCMLTARTLAPSVIMIPLK